jgi:hypothetical protein
VAFVPEYVSDLFLTESLAEELARADQVAGIPAGTALTELTFFSILDQKLQGTALTALLATHPRDLSAGTQVALAIALQLSWKPSVMLIDEPSRGLDPAARSSMAEVLRCVAEHNLLEIPEALQASSLEESAKAEASDEDESEDRQTERALAIQAFLNAPFSQIEPMMAYLSGDAHFDTHQGVKGLEFDRVMVIMDDAEARGFSFKYEDLFGGKAAGEKTVENTKRLFYVTASRAKESLALVAYSSNPDQVKSFVLKEEWFTVDEVFVGVPC